MSTKLTTTADATKKGAIIFTVGIILFVVLRFTFTTAYTLCCVRPTPSPTPYMNALYGPIEPITLLADTPNSANKTFHLETIDGTINSSTISALIYETVEQQTELNYAEKSQKLATAAQINNPKPIQENNTFIFHDVSDPNKTIKTDFRYFNFNYNYGDITSSIAFEKGLTPSIQDAANSAFNFISQLRPDINQGSQNISAQSATGSYGYYNPTTRQTTQTTVQQESNLTKVNFYRAPINNIPFVTPERAQSLMTFTYSGAAATSIGGNQGNRLLSADVIFWQIKPLAYAPAVYPIRSAQEAYQELTLGKGYILSKVSQGEEYNIRTIYLAYYEPPSYQKYIQPVWVFDGDKIDDTSYEFRAIVPAVIPSLIKQ